MSATVTVDYSRMDRVFQQYMLLSRKSLAEALNHQFINWCWEASRLIRKASVSRIMELSAQHPPKLIAWLLSRDRHGAKKAPGDAMRFGRQDVMVTRAATPKTRKDGTVYYPVRTLRHGHKVNGSWVYGQQRERARRGFYSRAFARDFAPKHFGQRARSAAFCLTFVSALQKAAGRQAGRRPGTGGGNVVAENPNLRKRLETHIENAGVNKPWMYGRVNYSYKHDTSAGRKPNVEGAAHVEMLVSGAFRATIPAITRNMQTYINRKLKEAAELAQKYAHQA